MPARSLAVSLILLFAARASAQQPNPPPAHDPVADRAQAIGEAAKLLDKAGQVRRQGNRNLAEQLFSSAELILGEGTLAELAPLFREGAPPRVTTPLGMAPKDAAPQPAVVGNSDEEDKPEDKPKRGSLQGALTLDGKALEGRGVVMLEPAGKKARHRAPVHRTVEQRNREFAPRLLAVPVGSTVSFPNFDPVYHNVFSRSEVMPFDLGIYKNGQSRDLQFDKEGIWRIGCNLHANMQAYIVVVNAAHYAVTDEKGRFSFRSLEPGKYRLRAWSDRTEEPVVQEITIAPAKNNVSVTLPANAKVANVDKFGAPRGK